jgi:hypothetical protein
MTEAPVINLNGSSPKTMIDDILTALNALNDATVAVARTAPHPRDWQTVKDGDSVFAVARRQHEVRLHKLHEIHDELEAIGLAIQEQDQARRTR